MTENSGTSSYYHADGNGNVTMLINSYQIPVAKYLFDPFGKPLSDGGPKAFANPIWYSSQIYDPDTGIIHYKYRPYFPDWDRFANRDPLGEQGGINLYEFVRNNPMTQLDPKGLKCCADKCLFEGAIRIDQVGASILPATLTPALKQIVDADVDLIEREDKVTGLIDVNIVNHLLPSVRSIYNSALNSLTEGEFDFIWTTVQYSVCEKVSCFVFWDRLDWVKQPLNGPNKYSQGATLPDLGYTYDEAEQNLQNAINANIANISEVMNAP